MKTVVLIGLPGKSDRPGYQRLYLTTKLNYYAEFLVSGILSAETIPANKSPFAGHEATQVTVGRDANIQYISAPSSQPVDEFDLDVRLGAFAGWTSKAQDMAQKPRPTVECGPSDAPTSCADLGCHDTQQRTCAATCTCVATCAVATCPTCQTLCGTCHTACGTCPGQCVGGGGGGGVGGGGTEAPFCVVVTK